MTDLCTPVDLFMGFAGLVTKLAKCLHHTALRHRPDARVQ